MRRREADREQKCQKRAATRGAYRSLTNRVWLSGELLSGSERRRPGWFLDMKCQTCLSVDPYGLWSFLTQYSLQSACCSVLDRTQPHSQDAWEERKMRPGKKVRPNQPLRMIVLKNPCHWQIFELHTCAGYDIVCLCCAAVCSCT